MSFCLCSLVSPASFTLTFPSAPAGARSPTQLVAKHPLLDKNWQISAGGWLLSLSLPAPPEPAPACLVAEEEAATSDRVPGSEVCTQCSHSSVHSGTLHSLTRLPGPAHNTQIFIDWISNTKRAFPLQIDRYLKSFTWSSFRRD